MTPIGALTLAILAGLAAGFTAVWFTRRNSTSRQQVSRQTQFTLAVIMILASALAWVSVFRSSTSSTFTVLVAAMNGTFGVFYLVQALCNKAVR